MALYAEIRKLEEDEQQVRYAYTDVSGVEQTLRLDKAVETIRLETGADDMLFRAELPLPGGRARGRLIV
ncbi:hypothetical protein AB0H00_13780 [Nocardia sp. NPDC023852]|uniref:hypothetical protein n=1 Tax=Nocardia sp. NPDC023852 TaxID=3154697 RepID=UPI0033FDCEC8